MFDAGTLLVFLKHLRLQMFLADCSLALECSRCICGVALCSIVHEKYIIAITSKKVLKPFISKIISTAHARYARNACLNLTAHWNADD